MPLEVGLLASFAAGLISFLSPCILPLTPAYLAFLAGTSMHEAESGGQNLQLIARAAAFVLGFSLVFIVLGASASAAGQVVADHLTWLTRLAGCIIVILGLHVAGLLRWTPLLRELRFNMSSRPVGLLGALVVGLAFGFGWTPCVGPVLATILLMTGTHASVGEGTILLTAYAAGIGVPFLLAAAFSGPVLRSFAGLKRFLPIFEKVMGGALIATGLLVLLGLMPAVGNWLLDMFPALGRIG
jgi:cytochrome c-type biogenesis protein